MSRRFWFSGTLAYQKSVVTQAKNKIDIYAETFGWLPEQVTAFKAVCDEIIEALNHYELCRASMQALTGWREQIFYGQPRGAVAGPAPVFDELKNMVFHNGVIDTFINYREQIVANPNYIPSIGEDMMLVGAEITPIPPSEMKPNLQLTTSGEPSLTGTDTVAITGSMQGNKSMKVLWTPKGGTTREVATITSTPANVTITKSSPNEPESGTLQAQYYNKNLPYGNPSPMYPITLA